MKWYEIIIGIAGWIIGFWIWSKFRDYSKNKYHNDSWRNRK